MRTIIAHIYLQDECRRIGCGWRTCIMQIGRKWVRLKERATEHTGKLPVSLLPIMRYREIQVRKRRRRPG